MVPLGPCVPSPWPCWATEEVTSLFDWGRGPHLLGVTRTAASLRLLCRAQLGLWSAATHSVPVYLDGVATVLSPALTLKEGTVVLELQALASEAAALVDF